MGDRFILTTDKNLDQSAQDAMFGLLRDLGFKNIEFEFEPIAAAAYYEPSVDKEEIALIVDMGGGTSDFTVTKLDKNSLEQKEKILSIGGIHIAGTNFDRRLSLAKLMPELGLGCRYKTFEGNWASIPPTLHKDLATWHKIGLCYSKPNANYVKAKSYSADEPHKFERLLQILNQRLGHHVAIAVEKGKIALTSGDLAAIKINDIAPPIDIDLTKDDLDNAIDEDVSRIVTTLKDTLSNAQVSTKDISAIFMTGGASLVPLVRNRILSLLPEAKLIDGDKFGSVATGLTLLSARKFY